ncbi:hypothetical protein [Sphingomonas sp. OTU376]|uniref:hypothetical protein n=1 Tax=Sphingomonas sp. OTU376 TaxID=3043863 RepID=UPI00313F3D5A
MSFGRDISVLLCVSVATVALGACRAGPVEPRSDQAAQSARPEKATQPTKPGPDVAKPIDFASDLYLDNVCEAELQEMRFKKFQSYDFIYESPLPVRVSGSYAEVRAREAGSAATVYDEIEATIFRDVEIEVEAKQVAPDYSFHRWGMPFAVSDHPFSAHRQLKHQRAMGATFPFLDLARIPFRDADDVDQPFPKGNNFSRNFISVLNFLASRGESVWGRGDGFDARQKARELRLGTTGTEYERAQAINGDALAALRRISPAEKFSISIRGSYILISLGRPALFVAAIDTGKDAVGLRACKGGR